MKSKWIPVTLKLPEPDKRVLCYCNHQSEMVSDEKWKQINIGSRSRRTGIFHDDYDYFIDVTHWMPLPVIPSHLFNF